MLAKNLEKTFYVKEKPGSKNLNFFKETEDTKTLFLFLHLSNFFHG